MTEVIAYLQENTDKGLKLRCGRPAKEFWISHKQYENLTCLETQPRTLVMLTIPEWLSQMIGLENFGPLDFFDEGG